MLAYNLPTHIGLVVFGTTVDLKCEISPMFEKFRDKVDAVKATGIFHCKNYF